MVYASDHRDSRALFADGDTLANLRGPAGIVTSAVQADLISLTGTPCGDLEPWRHDNFSKDVRTCLTSLAKFLPPRHQSRNLVEYAERDPVMKVGVVRSLQVSRTLDALNISLVEHDKAFIFDTNDGASTYLVTAGVIMGEGFGKPPYYMTFRDNLEFFPAHRMGDALVRFQLSLVPRHLFSFYYGRVEQCSLEVFVNSNHEPRCDYYRADLNTRGGVAFSGYEEGKPYSRSDSFGARDLEFASVHFMRLLNWAAPLAGLDITRSPSSNAAA